VNPATICQSLNSHNSKVRHKLFPATADDQDFCGSLHATLLTQGDRSKATTKLVLGGGHTTGLHFHKIEVLPAATYDVDLTVSITEALTQDLVASV